MMIMEKALILACINSKAPTGLPEMIKDISGVTDAKFIYGPYDLYAIAETETKEELRAIITKILNTGGIKSTMTCRIM